MAAEQAVAIKIKRAGQRRAVLLNGYRRAGDGQGGSPWRAAAGGDGDVESGVAAALAAAGVAHAVAELAVQLQPAHGGDVDADRTAELSWPRPAMASMA